MPENTAPGAAHDVRADPQVLTRAVAAHTTVLPAFDEISDADLAAQ